MEFLLARKPDVNRLGNGSEIPVKALLAADSIRCSRRSQGKQRDADTDRRRGQKLDSISTSALTTTQSPHRATFAPPADAGAGEDGTRSKIGANVPGPDTKH